MKARLMPDNIHWGEFNERGEAVRQTRVCALTGEPVDGGGVVCRIDGTNLFYRLSAAARRKLTADQRQDIEDRIRDAAAGGTKPSTASAQAADTKARKSEAESDVHDRKPRKS